MNLAQIAEMPCTVSVRGRSRIAKSLLVRGKRVLVIAALAVDSVLDFYFTCGTANGETFKDFIEQSLLPHLMPFDGTNPRSVVIMLPFTTVMVSWS